MATVFLVLWMLLLLYSCLAAGQFKMVVPAESIQTYLGSSVVLPCGISPPSDCKSFEVRWHRPNNYVNPVFLYENFKIQDEAGDPSYRGRASLVGQLERGNVSLKLENLTIADRGTYVCFVKSPQWYEQANVQVSIRVTGSDPVLSLVGAGEKVNATCTSGGWSPQPALTWTDKSGKQLQDDHHRYTTDSEGLVSVSSWLLFSAAESDWISCSVGLSDQEKREGRVIPYKIRPLVFTNCTEHQPQSDSASAVRIVLIVLVCSLLLFTGIGLYFGARGSRRPEPSVESQNRTAFNTEQKTPLMEGAKPQSPTAEEKHDMDNKNAGRKNASHQDTPVITHDKAINTEEPAPAWDVMNLKKVALTLNTKVGPNGLEVMDGIAVICTSEKKEKGFAQMFCEQNFQKGQYYWELTYTFQYKHHRKQHQSLYPTSWYAGVTMEKPSQASGEASLTPREGRWILIYEQGKGYYVHDKHQTPVLVRDRVTHLAVYLDCDNRTLSFYDCEARSHLYTFYNVKTTEPLIPVVGVGVKEKHGFKLLSYK